MINAVSLFSNVGIGETFLKEANINVCVANELLKIRCDMYRHLNPDCNMICGDITNKNIFGKVLDEAQKNNCRLLLATPPCQGMSTAGKMEENDYRNSLIMYAIDFALQLKPEFILFENVPQQKKTKLLYEGELMLIPDIVTKILGSEYNIKYDVLNAANYGVPQTRKRLIFIMVRKDVPVVWNFPKICKKVVTVRDAIGDLESFESIPKDDGFNLDKKFYTVKTAGTNKWHKPSKMANRHIIAMMHTPTGHSAFENSVYYPKKLDGKKMKGYFNTFKRIDWDKPAPTITMQSGNIGSQENGHPGRELPDGTYSDARVLSILEIMRLMSLPDDWNIPDWSSDKLIRDVIGEGVPPLMMKKIVFELTKGVK